MIDPELFVWFAVGFLLLKATQYALGARIYLTSAVREPEVAPLRPEGISAGEHDLLTSVDAELQNAGFRHVGFGQCAAFLTYHGPPEILNVFVHEQMSAYAIVRRHPVPELDQLVGISIQTEFPSGEILVNTNIPVEK